VTAPVLFVHGWAGSHATTWERPGITALVADSGRRVIGVDLLGHGTAPAPHEPEAYADLTERVMQAMPAEPVDAVGFSLGALTLLRCAVDHPDRFSHLVLAGIGRNVFETDEAGTLRILDALEGRAPADDTMANAFAHYADAPGNDRLALAAVLRRPRPPALAASDLTAVTCPVLVVVGDRDPVHPADDLVAALPNATLRVLPGVDHFATPESFGFLDAMLEFLDAVPT
jgi:pimeloyl-ACP methyl ester carboxylesterase